MTLEWILKILESNWPMFLRGAGVTLLIALAGTLAREGDEEIHSKAGERPAFSVYRIIQGNADDCPGNGYFLRLGHAV